MRIGITGHRRLDPPGAWAWVEAAMAKTLDDCNNDLVAVTSLAIGADQLFAALVLRRGGAVHAVIPFADYERTFSAEDLDAYRRLLAASTVEILDTPGTDEDAYLAAGQRVVALSDLLIAVWNGEAARGKGGTGDIVGYAVGRGVQTIHIHPTERTVIRK
jgi:hypothetical protein